MVRKQPEQGGNQERPATIISTASREHLFQNEKVQFLKISLLKYFFPPHSGSWSKYKQSFSSKE
jgi:hypothetical protein